MKMRAKFSTCVVMLNLGGPNNLTEVKPFLENLFSDRSIIRIPFGLGKLVALPRAKIKIEKQYSEIGGKSPLKEWTEKQSNEVKSTLKDFDLEFFPGFRYGFPTCEETLNQILEKNPEKIILFSQYPQYSCSTGGNSIRNCLQILDSAGYDLNNVNVIDRWFDHPLYIAAHAKLIKEDLKKHFEKNTEETFILFTSHSIPFTFMKEGDVYPYEISATVNLVMRELQLQNPYRIAWQSKVGFQPWLGPSTIETIQSLGEQKVKNLLLVPIGFTSDHLETLYELDVTIAQVAQKAGIPHFVRSRSLNVEPLFIQALSDILSSNILEGKYFSKNTLNRCPNCQVKEECKILTKFCNIKF